jgi:Putative zinc- or iron-chelating domain
MLRRRKPSLEDVYRQVPPVQCRGLCLESCGPISMSRHEEAKLLARGVKIPPMAEAMAALERGEDYYCPALRAGRCSVYDDRPTICRLWGATESMPCPHGCTPDNRLTQAESHRILRLAAEVGGGMVDDFNPTDP